MKTTKIAAAASIAAAPAAEQVVMMKRAQLRESPFNPRKTYNEAALAELADTMRPPHGRMHSPIVVRPLDQADIEQTHEIVFGHRRNRAAARAQLDEVPVIVRAMTDEEARIAQLIENAQREDVTALEEADSLNELRHQCGVEISDLMKRTGKSRRYVFASLKLATAHDEVRAACASGLIGSEVAKLLATVPNPLQPKALEESIGMEYDYGARDYVRKVKSSRVVKILLEERYRLKLADAPFDTLSIKLIPGVLACDACPRRSDNEPTLLEDCGAGVCTDPDCFAAKRAAHTEQQLATAKKKGLTVIEGEAAKELLVNAFDENPDGYVPVTRKTYTKSLAGIELTYAGVMANMGKKAPAVTLIAHPHRAGAVLECITEEQAEAVLRAAGTTREKAEEAEEEANNPWMRKRAARAAEEAAEEAKRTPEERAVWGIEWNAIKMAILRRVAQTPRTFDELRIMALNELSCVGDFGAAEEILGWEDGGDDGRDYRLAKVHELSADQLAQLLVMVAIDREEHLEFGNRLAGRLHLAKVYGVDPLDPTAESAPPPSTAARAPKGAAGKANVKKAARALDAKPAANQAALDLKADVAENLANLAKQSGEQA